jgi:isocitrate dehydrogenase (NAD+)
MAATGGRRGVRAMGEVLKRAAQQQQQRRTVTYMPRPGDGAPRAVTLLPGDGIGPLVTGAAVQVMKAMHAPVFFEEYEAVV